MTYGDRFWVLREAKTMDSRLRGNDGWGVTYIAFVAGRDGLLPCNISSEQGQL